MVIANYAKQRLLINVVSNFIYVILNSLIIVILTPYLIDRLGVELYGLIPLVISFVSYFNLLTMSIASSLNRYVTLNYHKFDYEKCNIYINSALWPLLAINVLLLVPVYFISVNFTEIFSTPYGVDKDVSKLFVLVILGAIITSISAPFMAGIYIKHRFDLDSLVKIFGKVLQVGTLVILFEVFEPSLSFYGVSYMVMALVILISMMYLQTILVPELAISHKMFNKIQLIEMSNMSFWAVINQIGALLYITIAILLVNILLGPEHAGRYAAIVQWVTLLSVIGGSISSVFVPIAYEYIAKDDIETLSIQICRSIRYITLIIGFPIAFLCGFSRPILGFWLGHEYIDLSTLMCLMLVPWIITIGVRPIFAIFTGMNKVSMPAVVTFLIGIFNVVLIYVFIDTLKYGLIGVAISLIICLSGKNLFFTTIYAALITKQKKLKYVQELLPGLLMASMFSNLCHLWSLNYGVDSLIELFILGVYMGVIYVLIVYMFFVSRSDKKMFLGIVKSINRVNNK